MNRRWFRMLSVAAIAPLAVDVPGATQDSSTTRFTMAMGAGSYATILRGCNGDLLSKTKHHYRDIGFAVEHDTRGPVEFGVRGGALQHLDGSRDRAAIVNPHVSLEGRNFGIGVGYVGQVGDDPDDDDIWLVSGHLRGGPRDRGLSFSIHVLEDLPIFSGGSPVRLGFGFHPSRTFDGWIGMSTEIPYDRAGLLVKSDIHVHRNVTLHLAGRLGSSEGIDESAGSAGVTFHFSQVRPERTGESPP